MTRVLVLALPLLGAVACSPDGDPGSRAVELERVETAQASRETFVHLSAAHGDNYRYTRFDQSWVGSWSKTELVVVAGAVTERIFESGTTEDDGTRPVSTRIEESGATLGVSDRPHPIRTIPQLYDECVDEVLTKDPVDNLIYLGLRRDGILEYCMYAPRGCQDDCATGPSLSDITF